MADDKSDHLSDIDDQEMEPLLLNADERRLKSIIWNNLNKEWLDE